MRLLNRILVALGVLLCRFWQRAVSPFFAPCCRYYPSCSEYCIQALHEHGFLRGSAMAAFRILRCNSLFAGGIEPVEKKCGR